MSLQALVLVEWPSREAFQGFLDGGSTSASRTCAHCCAR